MRVVLDTNVLVAGVLSTAGPPGWIVEAMVSGLLVPAFDMAMREEYDDVLRRPEFAFPASTVDDLLAALDRFGLPAAATLPLEIALPDPDDEPFLAVAAATGSVLITGNVRHFPASHRQGVTVLTPREFVDRYKTAVARGRRPVLP